MTEADDRFTLNFERDRLFWVLEKLELAAYHLEADDAPIQERLQRALLAMPAGRISHTICVSNSTRFVAP